LPIAQATKASDGALIVFGGAGGYYLLEEMRRQGYWLSDELLDVAARMTAKA